MTETSKTIYWDQLKTVPKDHLKPFKRSGGFSGTAIKPMWAIHRMTELFGPCGMGWGIDVPDYRVQAAGDEILVYCIVTVWYQSEEKKLVGIGGDKILAKFSSGLKSDDEAFKKAFTDAVGNALKHLGVAAEVHMGHYDGAKYATPNGQHEPNAPVVDQDAILEGLTSSMNATKTLSDLTAWDRRNEPNIMALSPDRMSLLSERYEKHKAALPQPKKLSERAVEASRPALPDDEVPF